jgi:hypothetical protein
MPPNNAESRVNANSTFKSFETPVVNTSGSKSVERTNDFNLTNQNQVVASTNITSNLMNQFEASCNDLINAEIDRGNAQPNASLSSKKEDLVDVISEAAKKLMNDPNSYYCNLRKGEKPSKEDSTNQEDSKVKQENKFTFNKSQTPIEPYQKSKSVALKEESKVNHSTQNAQKLPLPKLSDVKLVKRKEIECIQAKVPSLPAYKPLPCLE